MKRKILMICGISILSLAVAAGIFFLQKYVRDEMAYYNAYRYLSSGISTKTSQNVFPDISQVSSAYITESITCDNSIVINYYFNLNNSYQRKIVSSILTLLNLNSGTLQDFDASTPSDASAGTMPTTVTVNFKDNTHISFWVFTTDYNLRYNRLSIYGQLYGKKMESCPIIESFMYGAINPEVKCPMKALMGRLEHKRLNTVEQ